MGNSFGELKDEILIDPPVSYDRLSVLPLRLKTVSDVDYLLLDGTEVNQLVELNEVSQQGSVPRIKIANKSEQLLFVPDGTVLVGAKQNRIVNISLMLAPTSETLVPVSCVERGRWSYSRAGFHTGGYGDSAFRAKMCERVSESLKRTKDVHVDQCAMWAHVEELLCCSGAASPSRDYQALYEEWNERIAVYESHVSCPENAFGVIVKVDGQIEVVDLFDRPDTLSRLWPRLVRSYSVAAVSPIRPGPRLNDARQFLDRALAANVGEFETAGVGTTARLQAEGIHGAALLFRERLVHLSLFANGRPEPHV